MQQHISGSSSLLPECDFPACCRELYPDDFRYPEGYFAPPTRITDAETLRKFDAWMRPYVIRSKDGEAIIDPGAPVPVRRLAQGSRDTTVISALRHLEWGGSADDSLQGTFAMEDRTEEAGLCSEAGRHREAVALIRTMPPPFQVTAAALVALVRSLKAMGRYAEALEESGRLIISDGITDYARDLYRIEQAELMLHCDRPDEATAVLNRWREDCQHKWPYYGVRAALALRTGHGELAKALILRAGKVDAYHCYKLLWNRHLEPLAAFIRRELLTEDNKPRLYQRNSDTRRLCHAIHGALLTGRMEQARNLAEGLQTQHVTDWDSGHQLVLALIGLGYFKWVEAASAVLPGAGMSEMKLAYAVARCASEPGCALPDVSELLQANMFSTEGRRNFENLLPWLSHGSIGTLPPLSGWIVADVAPSNWTNEGRDHFVVVHDSARGFEAQRVFQDRSVHRPSAYQLRELFPVLESIKFDSTADFEAWLESRIQANAGANHPYRRKWDVDLNGWALPVLLKPDSNKTPLLARAVAVMHTDPSMHFAHGPAMSYGMSVPFGDRLLHMLRCHLRIPEARKA
ncbi:MAG TPA: hypothetical protein VLE43_03350 [Candidatus Saccharimonadia bacterium]|nr:hypothetical protein [Candidatus Saccharimonadia bacterium]